MKTKRKVEDFEIEVDPRPLTSEEEKTLSDFIAARKLMAAKENRQVVKKEKRDKSKDKAKAKTK